MRFFALRYNARTNSVDFVGDENRRPADSSVVGTSKLQHESRPRSSGCAREISRPCSEDMSDNISEQFVILHTVTVQFIPIQPDITLGSE